MRPPRRPPGSPKIVVDSKIQQVRSWFPPFADSSRLRHDGELSAEKQEAAFDVWLEGVLIRDSSPRSRPLDDRGVGDTRADRHAVDAREIGDALRAEILLAQGYATRVHPGDQPVQADRIDSDVVVLFAGG